MQRLNQVIAALRQEIELGLGPAASGRATVSLRFALAPGNGASREVLFHVPGEHLATETVVHTLQLEFEVGAKAHSALPKPAEVKIAPLDEHAAMAAQNELAQLFGKPGFDSAARATVFREALESLDQSEAAALASAMINPTANPPSPDIHRALSLLDRVMKSGPSGIANGRRILSSLLQHHTLSDLRALVASVWKGQEDWIA